VILGHLRRRLVRVSVKTNPTAECIAGQITEAFPWDALRRRFRITSGVAINICRNIERRER